MKQAGLKNSGAWFRFNTAIRALPEADKTRLGTLIKGGENIDAAFNAILTIGDAAGITSPAFPSNVSSWVDLMLANGIPLQVWMGRLSFTIYDRVDSELTGAKYVPKGQSEMLQFARDLRKQIATFIRSIRELNDLTNTRTLGDGNPGGLPDGNPAV